MFIGQAATWVMCMGDGHIPTPTTKIAEEETKSCVGPVWGRDILSAVFTNSFVRTALFLFV